MHHLRWLIGLTLLGLIGLPGVASAKKANGEACRKNRDCRSGDCATIYAEPMCVPRQNTAGKGQWCNAHAQCRGAMACRKGHRCGKPDRALGERCYAASHRILGVRHQDINVKHGCISGRCDLHNRVCIPNDGQGRRGDYCTHNNHCKRGTRCVANACGGQGAQNGAECKANLACASGVCDLAHGNPKKCIPANGRGKLGSYCSHNHQCQSRQCLGMKCVRRVVRNVGLGKRCVDNSSCRSRVCDMANGPDKRCIPANGRGKAGHYCTHNNQCQSGECRDGQCNSGGGQVANGQQCRGNSDCRSGDCATIYAEPMCVPRQNTAGKGQWCNSSEQCRGAMACRKNNRCGKPDRNLGERCYAASVRLAGVRVQQANVKHACKSGRCDLNNHKCIPNDGTGRDGQFCTHNRHCRSGTCKRNACKAPAKLGQSCSTGTGCRSGRCDRGMGNPRKCIPNDGTGRRGDYCTHNNQCRPGRPCMLKPGKRYGKCN